MSNDKGILIVMEGPDGGGKTHILKNLETYLWSHDISVFSMHYPLMARDNETCLEEFKMTSYIIKEAVNKNDVVILDRYTLSNMIYGDNVYKEHIASLVELYKNLVVYTDNRRNFPKDNSSKETDKIIDDFFDGKLYTFSSIINRIYNLPIVDLTVVVNPTLRWLKEFSLMDHSHKKNSNNDDNYSRLAHLAMQYKAYNQSVLACVPTSAQVLIDTDSFKDSYKTKFKNISDISFSFVKSCKINDEINGKIVRYLFKLIQAKRGIDNAREDKDKDL